MNSTFKDYASYVRQNISKLDNKKVIIIGDVGLDEYVFGSVRRISPEAPVPVVEVETQEFRLGLAANVAQNIASLGGVPYLISIVGNDSASEDLRKLLKNANVSTEGLMTSLDRPTTRKTRIMVQNHHIVRVDYERKQFLSEEVEASLLKKLGEQIDSCVAVIVQDYAKGVLSKSLISKVVTIAHQKNKKVLADPNRLTPIDYYTGVDLMTPNYEESVALSHYMVDSLRPDKNEILKIGIELMKSISSKEMVITRGKEGMSLFQNGQMTEMPTFAKQVADVTGAGDTVVAAIALAWGSGFSLENACALANLAAGVVVAKVGCVPCSREEVLSLVQGF